MGELRKGENDFYNLLEGCSPTHPSKKRDEAYDKWDEYYGDEQYSYVVYALLDITKPGPFTFGPLTFTHSPFYIGHGNSKKRVKKSRDYFQQADEYSLKVNKMKQIYEQTGNPYMRVTLIGSFKTKNKAALVERKIIQLIRDCGHILDNSNFSFCEVPLREEDYMLMSNNYIITT